MQLIRGGSKHLLSLAENGSCVHRHLQQEAEAAQRQAAAASATTRGLEAQVAALEAQLGPGQAPSAAESKVFVVASLRETVVQLEQQLQDAQSAATGR